jgi:hypothetical protein
MKGLISITFLSLINCYSFSQDFKLKEFSIVGGKNYSTFLFHDSKGNKDKSLDVISLNTFGANASMVNGKSSIRPEFIFRQAGAKSDADGLPLSWKMNYVDLNLGYLYSVFQSNRFSISPGLALGFGYMMNGEQYIGNMRYSLVDTKALSRFDCTAHGLTNFKLQLSEDINLSLEYRIGLGIKQIEKDQTEQKTRNLFQSALLAIGFFIR